MWKYYSELTPRLQGPTPLSTPEQLFSNRSLRIRRHTSAVASNLPEAALSYAGVLRLPRRFSVRLFVQDADFLFERDFYVQRHLCKK